MTDRPIVFSAPMVQAILAGRKSMTRRLLKPQPVWDHGALGIEDKAGRWIFCANSERGFADGLPRSRFKMPYAPGDRLYVREAFNAFQFSQDGDEAWPVKIPTLEECKEAEELAYRYGAPQIVYRESDRAREWFADQKWRPSIHMPRWASRLTLTVTEVRVQRLQDISEDDAAAEGVHATRVMSEGYHLSSPSFVESFRGLWNRLHGPTAWDENPWVVALTFTVQRGNIDQIGKA